MDIHLSEAQRYLTVNDGFSERKLFDIESLSDNHDTDEMIMFLCDLYYEKQDVLARLMSRDDNSILLDMTIAAMFRITQAITVLNETTEEGDVHGIKIKYRAEVGGTTCPWNCERRCSARFRKNSHNAA